MDIEKLMKDTHESRKFMALEAELLKGSSVTYIPKRNKHLNPTYEERKSFEEKLRTHYGL